MFQVKSTKHILEPWNFAWDRDAVSQPNLRNQILGTPSDCPKTSWFMITSEVYSRAKMMCTMNSLFFFFPQKTKVEASKESAAVSPTVISNPRCSAFLASFLLGRWEEKNVRIKNTIIFKEKKRRYKVEFCLYQS